MAIDPARAKSLFLGASDIMDSAQRAAFLDRECGGEVELRRRVEALLRANADGPPSDPTNGHEPGRPLLTENYVAAEPEPGAVIAGKYKLSERIGEGGMGSVWVAQQTEPVKRKVAVKFIKAGMDSKQVLARFEAERQALAVMDHPNIAKVLDGGLHDGRPFFVMELVKGVPITEYCDARKLTPRQRLELFAPVCQAIQHAHQKGIIHRDIKPSNVLIALYDDHPVAKVIDFGIVKATGGALTEQTIETAFGGVVGTPEYMSPEQASLNNLDIDTRSDVYSLGVLLYELLTGSPPFSRKELEKKGFLEMLRMVREDEPPRPSTKLSTADALPALSANRGTEPRKLAGLLRNELDWIVMKALEKDRSRRYETANGLAADVQRYLSGEAVQAHPPSAAYRLKKFARRNRPQVIGAGLVLMALLAGITGTTLGLLQANAKRREAERNLAFAKKGNEILGSVFAGLHPRANYVTVADLRNALRDNLTKAVKELEGSAVGDPVEVGDLQDTLGRSLLGLGETPLAIELFQKSFNTCKSKLGPDHRYTLISMSNLASAYKANGQLVEAVQLLEETLEKQKAVLGPDHPDTLSTMNSLASVYHDRGEFAKAVPLFEETLQKRKAKLGPDHPNTLISMNNLAEAYRASDQLAKALPLFEETLEKMNARLGPDHPDTLAAVNNLAGAYRAGGQIAKVVPLLEANLSKMKARLGPDHPDTLAAMNNLAVVYQDNDQIAKAVPLLEATLDIQKAKLGPDHPSTLNSTNNLAMAYIGSGQLAKAAPLLEATFEKMRAKLGPDHPDTLATMNNLAIAYQAGGQFAKSLPLFEESLKKMKAKLGPDQPDVANAMRSLATAYAVAGRFDQAIPLLEETLQKTKAKLGPDHPVTLADTKNLADAYMAAGRLAKVVPLLEEIARRRKTKLGPNHSDTLAIAKDLEFVRHLATADERFRAKLAELGPNHLDTLLARRDLAQMYMSTNKFGAAESILFEILQAMKYRAANDEILTFTTGLLARCVSERHRTAPDAWATFNALSMFAGVLLDQKRYAEAEPLLLKGYEGLKQRQKTIPPEAGARIPEAIDRLIELYTATNKPDEAKKWQAERAKYPDTKKVAEPTKK